MLVQMLKQPAGDTSLHKASSAWYKPWEREEDNRAGRVAGATGLLALGGGSAKSGIDDLRNRNVMVTYGAQTDMGSGHKAPANQVKLLLEELKRENAGKNFLGQLNVVDAPLHDWGGLPEKEVTERLRGKKYLTGVETGWGFIDQGRESDNLGPTGSLIERLRGEKMARGDKIHLRRFKNQLIFEPDAYTDSLGFNPANKARVNAGAGDVKTVIYGDVNPMSVNTRSKGNILYAGRAHPLIDVNLPPPMARGEYENFLLKYLRDSGYTDLADDAFKGKKIITVSGAGRGDTVGARARWAREALERTGKNPSDYMIIGVGGPSIPEAGDKISYLERNRRIAGVGGTPDNIFIGPRLGSPAEFNTAVSNSDLHLLGMGGSSPPEAVAHGGAKVAVFDDEQVFRATQPGKWWGDQELIPSRGIHGYEKRLIDAYNSGVPEKERLKRSSGRAWMNKVVDSSSGREKTLASGLDGVREYLALRGGHTVQSDDFGSLIRALEATSDKLAQNAELARNDLLAGRSIFKDILRNRLVAARRKALLHGTGKLGLAAGAVTGAGLLAAPLLRKEPTWRDRLFGMGKSASVNRAEPESSGGAGKIIGGTSLGLLGAGMYDTGNSLAKVHGISRPYVLDASRYLRKYPLLIEGVDTNRVRDFLSVMDNYANSAQELSRLRVMGLPAHRLTGRFPLSTLTEKPIPTVLEGVGLGPLFLSPSQREEIRSMQAHYSDAGKNMRGLLAREMLGGDAHPEVKMRTNVAKVMGLGDAADIINMPADVPLTTRFKAYLDAVDAGKIRGTPEELMSPFISREKEMLRGLRGGDPLPHEWDPRALRQHTNKVGIKGYGLQLSPLSRRFVPKFKAGGIGLGIAAAGLTAAGLAEKGLFGKVTL